MLAHEDGLAAPEDKANAHSSDHQSLGREGDGQQQTLGQKKPNTHPSDYRNSGEEDDEQQQDQQQQEPNAHPCDHQGSDGEEGGQRQTRQQQQKPQQKQIEPACLQACCVVSDQGARGIEARRRRRLGSSSPGPEIHVPESTTKRKRTPSRRVVEAAESALLLEEVMASEGLESRGAPTSPSRFAADYSRASSDAVPSYYTDTYSSTADGIGNVATHVAALSGAGRQQQHQAGLSEMARSLGLEGAAKGLKPQTGNQKTAGCRGTQRLMAAVTEEVPLCRRPLFGAVEPRDLLGFGVPLREVLGTREHQGEQQQQQSHKEGEASREANTQHRRQPHTHQMPQQPQRQRGETPSFVVDVAVVGAGVAGLAAAAYLRRCGASVVVFEGRHRVGGRTFSSVMPERVLPDGRKVERVVIDLGASYMHCVTAHPKESGGAPDCRWRREPSRSVSGIAAVLQPLVADVAGKQNWESTLFASWSDEASGKEVPFLSVLKVHQLLDRLRERTAAKLLHLPPPLTEAGGAGPPAASLPNTIPAAEFLAPSLDELLAASLDRKRSASRRNNENAGPAAAEAVVDPTGKRHLPTIQEDLPKQNDCPCSGLDGEDTEEHSSDQANPTALQSGDSGCAVVEEDAAHGQHDASDPCCQWAPGSKESGLRKQNRSISNSRFSLYYPLGEAFVRKAIRAYGGCPLCCTGACGGASRRVDERHGTTGGAADGSGDSCRREGLWGSPAPLVQPGGCGKTLETPIGDAGATDGELTYVGGALQIDPAGGANEAAHCSLSRSQPYTGDLASDGKDPCKADSALQQQLTRKELAKRPSGVCTRARGSTAHSSSTSNGQQILKGSRPKKSSTTTGAHAHTRLVPPLSLHDNRGFRRSAWDALQVSLCEILAEAEADEGAQSVGANSRESINRDCRALKPRKPPLTPAEARMLLVVLQSRLGYVGDLRELPLSAVKNYPYEVAGVGASLREELLAPQLGPPPVPLSVPPAPSMQRLRMQQAALEASLQQEQHVHAYPFSASTASSADKLVVDGWGWLPLFLCLQVSPFVVTEATVQSISVKDRRRHILECPGTTPARPMGTSRISPGDRDDPVGDDDCDKQDEEATHDGSFLDTHPVRLRVEVNRRLRHNTSHGLPQAEKQDEPPTHIWAHAKYCVVAVPLSQLAQAPLPCTRASTAEPQLPPTLGLIDFSPPLGIDRRRALARYRMGCHNKVIIRWHPDDVFWHERGLQLNCLDQKFQFLNLHAYGKPGCLLAHCFPPFSTGYGGLHTDQEVVAEVLALLQQMFGISDASFPRPVDFVVSRWDEDCFSRGSYSTPGVNAYDNDLDIMRAPHPAHDPRVLFCGEHLSKAYFQCVDGAFDTGLRAGEAVAHECLQLPLPPREDGRNFALDCFCLPPVSAQSVLSSLGSEEVHRPPKANIASRGERHFKEPSGTSDDVLYKQISQGLLPQCPFSGFPMPPLPRVLRGHYLTDQSDLGLTDAEGENWADAGGGRRGPQTCESERRTPQVAAAEEYFLAHCLAFIKRGSRRLLQGLALQYQGIPSSGSPLEQFPIDDACYEGEPFFDADETRASGNGGSEATTGEPPAVPPVHSLSEVALSFLQRLPTAAQRLFYRTFLSEFPLAPPSSSVGADQEQRCKCTPSKPEQQDGSHEGLGSQQQLQLPLLTDFLDAIFLTTSNASANESSQYAPFNETAILLSQTFARRLKRGSGGKALDMESFLLLLAKKNSLVLDVVLRPIRALAHSFPGSSEERGPTTKAEAAEVPLAPDEAAAASLERFVKELMLPALPAHARNTKPPRMAAVSVGVLLMETLERLCAAVPPATDEEHLKQRATLVEDLVLKNLANSQFVSAIGSSGTTGGVPRRHGEGGESSDPLQHEQLCWLCRGEGDLLLCDGLPSAATTPGAACGGGSSGLSTVAAAPRPCRHVFHIGCAFPPPTAAELQPNAHWSCPLCKAKAFRERRNAQQGESARSQQEGGKAQEQHSLQNGDGQQGHTEHSAVTVGAGSAEARPDSTGFGGDLLHYIFESVERLAQQGTEERTAQQSQRQLAACEDLQMAALKRLFVDKSRSLLARTRQLCKRLEDLQSMRMRSWGAGNRRKLRMRSKAGWREHLNPEASESVECSGGRVQAPPKHKQVLPVARRPIHSSSTSKDKGTSEQATQANRDTATGDTVWQRGSHASTAGASSPEGEGKLFPDGGEEERTRRMRPSALGGKAEGSAAAAGRSQVDSDRASTANTTLEQPQAGRADNGEKDVSAGSQDEAASEEEADRPTDPFAAAAQTPRFAIALNLLSRVQAADESALPLSVSALQHLRHSARGCCCSHKSQPSRGKVRPGDGSGCSTDKKDFCRCRAEASSKDGDCQCVRSARMDAAAALRGLLVFGKHMPTATARPRRRFRCLAPHVSSKDADIEALCHGESAWLNRLSRPSRRRRPQQFRTASRDIVDGKSSSVQQSRQQTAVHAGGPPALQSYRQPDVNPHQKSVADAQQPVSGALLHRGTGVSCAAAGAPVREHAAAQLPFPILAQHGSPAFMSAPSQGRQATASSSALRSLWQLLQAVREQPQQQQQLQQEHAQSGRGSTISVQQPLVQHQLHQQLQLQQQLQQQLQLRLQQQLQHQLQQQVQQQLLQQERSAAALRSTQERWAPVSSGAGERNSELMQQLALLRASHANNPQAACVSQGVATPGIEQQLERQLQELLRRQRLQASLRGQQLRVGEMRSAQHPVSTSPPQGLLHQQFLSDRMEQAQHAGTEQQRLRERLLRLQQLQRQLRLLQQRQRSDSSGEGQA
ncbi:amine oxidase, flavin-containing domain-containing protein, putative [Eimeria praecox]|uniref:Amine oxidase, flavin-containing domain-containing protein, putative n=1 Tax=Eimeria praecox TaxID=51316 RepID=U6H8U3_9EIME|nr:amine oxidase, flavin-containing domain-containing protein, putative [Eimeria praecox]